MIMIIIIASATATASLITLSLSLKLLLILYVNNNNNNDNSNKDTNYCLKLSEKKEKNYCAFNFILMKDCDIILPGVLGQPLADPVQDLVLVRGPGQGPCTHDLFWVLVPGPHDALHGDQGSHILIP